MTDWLPQIPIALAMVIAAIVPAYPWIRCFTRSSLVAVAVSPALSLGIVTVFATLFHAVGLGWTTINAGILYAVITIAGVILFYTLRQRNPELGRELSDEIQPRPPFVSDAPTSRAYRNLPPHSRVGLAICVMFGWVIATLPMFISANPHNPIQQWDPTFHLNGVWSILHTHNAQLVGSLEEMYGGYKVFYPDTWHAFVALFASPETVVEVSNVSSIFLMGVWVVGCAALTSVVTNSRAAVLAAPIIAGALPNMPADALTAWNQWPNATAVALTPAVAAFSILLGRRLVRASEKGILYASTRLTSFPLLLLALIGVAGAHPAGIFALAVFLIPPIIASSYRIFQRCIVLRDIPVAVGALLVAFLALFLPIGALTTGPLLSMGRYYRTGDSWLTGLTFFLTPHPPYQNGIGLTLTVIVVSLLCLVGVVVSIGAVIMWNRSLAREKVNLLPQLPHSQVSREERVDAWTSHRRHIRSRFGANPLLWPVVSLFLLSLLTLLAYSPTSDIRAFLLAPWYKDARRIMAFQDMAIVPLTALGFERVVNWLRAHKVWSSEGEPAGGSMWRTSILLGAWLLAITLGGGMDMRLDATSKVYDTDNLGISGMATTGELNMMRRMSRTLPPDAVVIGDPIAGAAYSQVIGQRRAVFPQLTASLNDTKAQRALVSNFKNIRNDPEVCEVIRKRGITHFYAKTDGRYYNFMRSKRYPGLYGVDVSNGFTLVDQGGDAKLYKITACD